MITLALLQPLRRSRPSSWLDLDLDVKRLMVVKWSMVQRRIEEAICNSLFFVLITCFPCVCAICFVRIVSAFLRQAERHVPCQSLLCPTTGMRGAGASSWPGDAICDHVVPVQGCGRGTYNLHTVHFASSSSACTCAGHENGRYRYQTSG